MLDRLKIMDDRYEEVNRLLSDPEVVCDIKKLTPFVLLHQSSSELEEQKDLYRKASERKASLIYQQKKVKNRSNQQISNLDDNEFIEVEDEIDITENGNKPNLDDDEYDADDNENDNENKNSNDKKFTTNNNNENKNSNETDLNNDDDDFNYSSSSSSSPSQFPFYLSLSHKLHRIISLDDVDSLQQILVHPDFSFDLRVDTSLLCGYELLMKKPTLIQLSAFYGSLKCFKYLYLNKASLSMNDLNEEMPNSIASFAISGGNIEIVRILISEKVDFSSSLFTSVSFHRDDLFFWFIENDGIEKLDVNDKLFEGMSLMHFAAESNNLSIAQFLIESDIKIDFLSNYDEDNIETPFNLACNYDCVGIVELICNHFFESIPREAVIKALSVCIASNSADSFAFLINFTDSKSSDGKYPFKLLLSEVRELKEKHGSEGFDELKQDCQIAKILNDFENKILSESKDK